LEFLYIKTCFTKKNIVKRIAQKNNPGGYLMNILIFGPNGSGKGTQGAVVQKNLTLLMLSLELFSGKTLRAEQSLAKKQRSILTEEIWFLIQ